MLNPCIKWTITKDLINKRLCSAKKKKKRLWRKLCSHRLYDLWGIEGIIVESGSRLKCKLWFGTEWATVLSPFVYEMHSDWLIVLDWFGTNYKVGKKFVKFLDGTTIGGPW